MANNRPKNRSQGWLGCLGYIAFFAFIVACTNYLNYNYNHRIVITKQAIMTYFLFQSTQSSSLDISEGSTAHFLNQTAEPVLVCIGADGDCTLFKNNANGPRELYAPGQKIQPGQLADVTFKKEGTYVLTVSILPHARFTVHVTHHDSD